MSPVVQLVTGAGFPATAQGRRQSAGSLVSILVSALVVAP